MVCGLLIVVVAVVVAVVVVVVAAVVVGVSVTTEHPQSALFSRSHFANIRPRAPRLSDFWGCC